MSVFGMHQCLPSALALSLSRWVFDWPAARRNVAQHKYLLRKGSLPSNRVNVNDAVRRGLLAVVLLLCGCTAAPVAVPRQLPVVADAQPAPTPAPAVAAEPSAPPTAAPAELASQPTAPPDQAAPPAQPAPQSAPAEVAPQATAAPQVPPLADPCSDAPRSALPAPGAPGAQDFFRGFRDPFPPATLYNPPGEKRVGLQAGHWKNDEVPAELGRLQAGATGGGKQEWEVNLDVAQRAATLVAANGVAVDVLPATVPPHYQANVFVAIHADGDPAGRANGFKIARPGFSALPDVDDRLVTVMNDAYEATTALPRDDEHISLRMRYYYAFNARRYCHSVATGVPQAIIEMGYLTSASDRQWLIGNPDQLARGIAAGITDFLATLP